MCLKGITLEQLETRRKEARAAALSSSYIRRVLTRAVRGKQLHAATVKNLKEELSIQAQAALGGAEDASQAVSEGLQVSPACFGG